MAVQNVRAEKEQCMLNNMESSPFQSSPTYDIVCVGLGTKTLALATALADHDPSQRVLILEQKSHFDANLASVSPANAAGSIFLRDLITLRNPRSDYTFINFLHSRGLLVGFTNVSQMRPSQLLIGEYLSWAAEKICRLDWATFNTEVIRIDFEMSKGQGKVDHWAVETRNRSTGHVSTVKAKRVIIATGNAAQIPESLAEPTILPFMLPMKNSANLLENISKAKQPLNIALLGADQQAAELMESLHSIPGEHRVTMIFPGSALRVEDGTPFTQESIDGAGSTLHHLPPELRQRVLATSVSSVYPIIHLETLESLYATLYAQSIREADKSEHRFQLSPLSEIVSAHIQSDRKIQLMTGNTRTGATSAVPGHFDIVCADYNPEASAWKSLLAPIKSMLDGNDISVDSHYKLNVRRGVLAQDCGLWVLGSLADRNTRRDDMTILAQVADRALESILSVAAHESMPSSKPTAVARL